MLGAHNLFVASISTLVVRQLKLYIRSLEFWRLCGTIRLAKHAFHPAYLPFGYNIFAYLVVFCKICSVESV